MELEIIPRFMLEKIVQIGSKFDYQKFGNNWQILTKIASFLSILRKIGTHSLFAKKWAKLPVFMQILDFIPSKNLNLVAKNRINHA